MMEAVSQAVRLTVRLKKQGLHENSTIAMVLAEAVWGKAVRSKLQSAKVSQQQIVTPPEAVRRQIARLVLHMPVAFTQTDIDAWMAKHEFDLKKEEKRLGPRRRSNSHRRNRPIRMRHRTTRVLCPRPKR